MTTEIMTQSSLESCQKIIDQAWDYRETLKGGENIDPSLKEAISCVMSSLDQGFLRVCEKKWVSEKEPEWFVHQWVKKAMVLSFRLNPQRLFVGGPTQDEGQVSQGIPQGNTWYDKIPLKTDGWTERHFQEAGFRSVPGALVRYSAFIDRDVVLMPSFVNVGARVGRGTMVDTWATVGSCAQIGSNCHISGGAGIGGVLEPLQANPVIIEDNCFIGARSEIVEGVIVEEGAVISMGVFLGASTKIVYRDTGEIIYGRVPAYSVVVPGTLPGKTPEAPHLACAVIVKQVDAQTRSKTSLNELLRH